MTPRAAANADTSHTQPAAVNPIARILLAGVYLPSSSPLRILYACPDILERIFNHVRSSWKSTIIPGYDGVRITPTGNVAYPWHVQHDDASRAPTAEDLSRVALCRVNSRDITFPRPKDLFCNMLPFRRDDLSTIPPEYREYIPLIHRCWSSDQNDIWYLTIHESYVSEFAPQRRAGIHVEGFLAVPASCQRAPWWHRWGMGLHGRFQGGIFHASTVDNSCRMWNVQIPREPTDVLGLGCDLDHLRGVLNESAEQIIPKSNELYWMTDATPHESLPLKPGTYRQYFRVVAGPISAWWSRHSTPNRMGIQPDCRILTHSKFEEGAYVNFDQHETERAVQSEGAGPSK